MAKIFETHAHYEGKRYDEDREELFASFEKHNIHHVINISFDVESSKKGILLAEKYPFVSVAVGIHPNYAKEVEEDYIQKLRELSKHKKVVAIGEIGLDYHYDFSSKDVQRKCFLEQLELVRETGLPVVIHNREADEDVYEILKDSSTHGVMHCFSGDTSLALKYIELGYVLGVGGIVTYKNADTLKDVVKNIPLDYLVVETDAPYLSPVPHRGKRNDSTLLKYITAQIAQIKEISIEEVEEVTWNNSVKLFNLSNLNEDTL